MKTRNVIYILLILVLGGLSYWLLSNRNKPSTIEDRRANYDFAVTDTAAVDRIVLADKSPSKVELVRTPKGWVLENGHPVRSDAMETLLTTLYRMRMRNFIPQRLQPTVRNRMAVYGTEVEVYSEGELLKSFTVGTEAEDEMATYMMIKDADAPYAVHIPGFNGFLSTRFFTEPYLWKKRNIVFLHPSEISEVIMRYPDSIQSSFRIVANTPEDIRLVNLKSNETIPTDLQQLRYYLGAISEMSYHGAIIPADPIYARRDSLLASTPVFDLSIRARNGETTNVKAYKIKGPEDSFDPDLPTPEFDPDKLHGVVNGEDMVLLQYYGLRRVLQPASHFSGS